MWHCQQDQELSTSCRCIQMCLFPWAAAASAQPQSEGVGLARCPPCRETGSIRRAQQRAVCSGQGEDSRCWGGLCCALVWEEQEA